jgi:hypothetical protein
MENNTAMNLYILNEVLFDYTAGMAVVAAPSLERCWELFVEKFGEESLKYADQAKIKVLEGVNHPEGVVSYVYGGG